MHQHRYISAGRRVLGLKERDVRLVKGSAWLSREERAVRVGSRGCSGWEAEREKGAGPLRGVYTSGRGLSPAAPSTTGSELAGPGAPSLALRTAGAQEPRLEMRAEPGSSVEPAAAAAPPSGSGPG